MSTNALQQLAARIGIEPSFIDVWQQERSTSDATRRAVLTGLGFAAESDHAARDSLAALEAADWQRPLPAMVFARPGDPIALEVTLDEPEGDRLDWQLGAQQGAVSIADLPVTGQGPGRRRRRLELPPAAGIGYLPLFVRTARTLASAQVAVCPDQAYTPPALTHGQRLWGVTAPLYGLKRTGDGGLGDFVGLAQALEACAGEGAAFLGINPIHALLPQQCGGISPYSPSSRTSLNVLHIAIDRAAAMLGVDAPALPAHDDTLIDYATVIPARWAAFEALFAAVKDRLVDHAGFQAFRATHGEALERQARFDALYGHFGTAGWRGWPSAYRSPDSPAVAAFAAEHADAVTRQIFLQWLAESQLGDARARAEAAGMALGLYLDLAVGVDPGGGDAWAYQDSIASRLSIGAPPDDFSPTGQNWGLAPFAPQALRATGFAPFLTMLRALMRHAGMIRIDHVLGLNRLYLVPGEADIPGAYVRYPLADLLRLIALESHLQTCLVIGEDLGTVPDDLRDALQAKALPGCRVMWFERERGGAFRPAASYAGPCIASISNHDLPTVAGFWQGRDIDWRARLHRFAQAGDADRERLARKADRTALLRLLAEEGLLPDGLSPGDPPDELPESVRLALHRFLARTPSALAAVQIEDALGLPEQANLPGTVDEHPNWRQRLPLDAHALGGVLRPLAQPMNAERSQPRTKTSVDRGGKVSSIE